MTRCWSLLYYYDDVKSESIASAPTTIFISVFSITYISYCLDRGESSQFFLPLFETDVKNTMKAAGGFMICYLLLITFSVLMVLGVRSNHPVLFLPLLTLDLIYIMLVVAYAIWLIASYYHNLLSALWFFV